MNLRGFGWSFCFVIAVVCPSLATIFDTRSTVESRQTQTHGAPSTSDFVNRAYHASSTLGGYLYIDGGEITFYDDAGVMQRLPDNNTYAIDLIENWDNETVVFHKITKTAPVMNYGHLWANRILGELYAFGGEQSQALPSDQLPSVPPTSFWRFEPSSNSGLWTEVTDSKSFGGITRPAGGAATAGGTQGFLLGGYSSSLTSSETADVVGYEPTPGMLVYNFTSNSWANNSALGFYPSGTVQHGQMHFVNGFYGHHGLVAAFGGETSSATSYTDNASNMLDLDTINIYDPVANQWYHQLASGTIPEPRDRFCTVGLGGDAGTYEIFIFGGHIASSTGNPQASDTAAQAAMNTARDEVFVLTIPGFHWEKAAYPARWPRVDHTCNIIGNGQMVVVGGLNPASSDEDFYSTVDPWANGLGVFDLTELVWTDGYNASAAKYKTPTVVKNWYAKNGGIFPQVWSDVGLKTYFTGIESSSGSSPSPSSSTSISASYPSSTDTSTDSSPSDTSSSGSSNSSDNSGVIAGAVVGSIVGVGFLFSLLWLLLRRRKQKKNGQDVFSLHSRDDDATTVVGVNDSAYSSYSRGLRTSLAVEPEKGPSELAQSTRVEAAELSPTGDAVQSPPPVYEAVYTMAKSVRKPLSMVGIGRVPLVEAPVGMGRVEMQG